MNTPSPTRSPRCRQIRTAIRLALAVTLLTGVAALPAGIDLNAIKGRIEPGPGNPPAEHMRMGPFDGVRLVCDFRSQTVERGFWDFPVRLDLSRAAGVRFFLLCRGAAAVSQFNVYIRSGGTWHAATFSPGDDGKPTEIRITKAQTRPEGVGMGWARVDRIRIAAWRGAPGTAVLEVADLDVLAPTHPVAIIRGGGATAPKGERGPAARYAENIDEALREFDILAALIDEPDVSTKTVAGFKTLILPHNPGMPDGAQRAAAAAVRAGAAVVGFYDVPAPVGEAIGLTSGAYTKASALPGGIGGIRIDPSALYGAPPAVAQASGNFIAPKAVGTDARVVGTWAGTDGRDSGQPAIVASGNGVRFGHVYLAKDRANGPTMILSMVARSMPEVWPEAVRGHLDQGARSLGAKDFAALAAGSASLRGRQREVEDLLRERRYAEALDRARTCTTEMASASVAALPAPTDEFRGAWCHRGYGIQGQNWDTTVRDLAAAGFNALLVNMANGTDASYRSSVLNPDADTVAHGDRVRECAAACTRYDVDLHVWKICLNLGSTSNPAFARYRREGRLQKTEGGTALPWLCPSDARNVDLEARAAAEIAGMPGVRGLHLDFIRFPGSNACYCDSCRAGFERAIGKRVAGWPEAVNRTADTREAFRDYRRQTITALVTRIRDAAKKANPRIEVSAAVFGNWSSARDSVGQDWVNWARAGLLDFVCPMDYHEGTGVFEAAVARQSTYLRGASTRLYPGIGLSSDHLAAPEVVRQINVCRKYRTGGFTVFELNATEARDIFPAVAPALRQ